ncbi:hypothetical protein G7Y89_g6235 [Cudoniella acicularis]|uniref:Uncharacterized protein n=1 Tax=Cudoniella acicularis TaxID=354080 RepID=A0A8H4RML9_9HELO|nr:hypothetical protein G7Y89_g6235 [Cudoniella acicularis]
MHDLFSIPEMVAAILMTDTVEHALLQNCLQVNRLFSHEATRILWDRCGTEFPISNSRNKEPTVHALANIAARDVSRARYYANCIRELRFVRSRENWPKITEGEQWHDYLLNLHFPILESFTSDGCTKDDSELNALKTTGPFYDFHSPERVGLFWHILRSSPKLKTIDLALDEPDFFESVEEEAIEFIKSTPALSSLSLSFVYHDGKDFPNNIWQPGVLSSLAALPVFRKLQGQNLSAKFLQNLPEGSFPALKELATGYAGSIAVLPSLFPHLSVLKLELSEPIDERLGRLADLSCLTYLDLTFAEDSTFLGPDLIALAHGCPHLTTVNLPSASVLMMEDPCPRGEDINDATIEAFARALPNLNTFCIGLEDRSTLTHQAIISLARHCPELGYFHITADVSMPDLIEGLKKIGDVPLQSMTYMRFYLPEDVKHTYEDTSELAEQLVRRLAPELCEFQINDGSESDIKLQDLVEGLIGVP